MRDTATCHQLQDFSCSVTETRASPQAVGIPGNAATLNRHFQFCVFVLSTCVFLVLAYADEDNSGGVSAQRFAPGRLTGKRASAEFGRHTPGQLIGSVEFAFCDTDGVFVKVNLEDSVTKYSCLTDPTASPCLYQINNHPVSREALAANGSLACGSVDDIFDPSGSGGRGWPPANLSEDICSSTQSSSFGLGSKLQECPVGGLSRKWGVLKTFFDDHLAVFNKVIGLSVLVYSLSEEGIPSILSCAPIEFRQNCNEEEKEALLDFRSGLQSGQDLLESWKPQNDMCDSFFGIRCDGHGHVAQVLLNDMRAMLAAAAREAEQPPTDQTAPTPLPKLEPSPSMNASSAELQALLSADSARRLVGPVPEQFSILTYAKVIKIIDQNLSGVLPPSWSTMSVLRELDLKANNISGRLPVEWSALSELMTLSLSHNLLTGTLPPEWSIIEKLEDLRFDHNRLVGTVPAGWSNFSRLVFVNMTENAALCHVGNVLDASDETAVDNCTDGQLIALQNPYEPDESSKPDNSSEAPSNKSSVKSNRPGNESGLPGGKQEAVALPPEPEPDTEPRSSVPLSVAVPVAVCSTIAALLCVWLVQRHWRRAQGDPKTPSDSTDSTQENREGPSCFRKFALTVNVDRGSEVASGENGTASHEAFALCDAAGIHPWSKDQSQNAHGDPPRRSLGSNMGTVAHCASGVHPLDFACVHRVPGATVDRELLLGSGGYGMVYKGTLTRNGKQQDVAVKVISNSDTDELHLSKYKSFQDEIATLSLFRGNDCIVQIHDSILDYPRAVIIYEYLENDTLARLIHKRPSRSLNYLEVLQMGYGIAEGLATLHAKNVIHRDLKPDNILLDAHMRPRLTDFGISRQKDPHVSSVTTQNIGTWIYMAPEQFNGRICESTDIYSLGMVLWECWSRSRPWGASGDVNEIWQVMYRLIHDDQRPEIPHDCPTDLANVIRSCWVRDPRERPSAVDVKNRLWQVILSEMEKLNDGPPRVTSPARRAGAVRQPSSLEGPAADAEEQGGGHGGGASGSSAAEPPGGPRAAGTAAAGEVGPGAQSGGGG